MIEDIKWYIRMWKKKDLTGMEVLNMCWASVFILLFLTGIVVLTVLLINYFN